MKDRLFFQGYLFEVLSYGDSCHLRSHVRVLLRPSHAGPSSSRCPRCVSLGWITWHPQAPHVRRRKSSGWQSFATARETSDLQLFCVCLCLCFAVVCMYVCMYVCTYVCMYVCMHACMYACMHVCMYAYMHVCMYVCSFVRSFACLLACLPGWLGGWLAVSLAGWLSVIIYVCQCVCVCVYGSPIPKGASQKTG